MEAIKTLIDQPYFWPITAAIFALLAVVIALWIYLRKTTRQRQFKRVLKLLGNRFLKDILIPDGIGGQIQLDYLVATEQGLLVLDVREFEGVLFGGEQLDQWAQMSQMKTYRFPNPLYDNSVRTVSVRELITEVPVFGRVVFHQGSSFPKGKPAGVSMLSELTEDLANTATNVVIPPEALDSAWEKITGIASPVTH